MRKVDWWLFGLMAFAIFTHFIFLTWPSEVVFDEFYFGRFASYYLTHTPYFDLHPPLGKMMLGLAGWVFKIDPTCTFEKIGYACPKHTFFALRFLPALFGTLLVFLFYKFIKFLAGSKKIALLGGFLLCLENSFLIQSRHILMDIFLIFFGVLSLFLFLKIDKEKTTNKKWLLLVLSGLALGACISIKWTGIGFVGLIGFLTIIKLAQNKITFKKFLAIGSVLAVCVVSVYLLQFWIHFSLIPGGGNVDLFLGKGFQNLPFLEKTIIINARMFEANQATDASHPANSRYYQWPFMKKSIGYWEKDYGNKQFARLEFIGNSVIWGLSSACMILLLAAFFLKKLRREIYPSPSLMFLLLSGFLINLAPFLVVSRSTFLYHYFPAYIFAIINLTLILNWVNKINKKAFWIIVFIIIVGFLVFTPLTYGFHNSYFDTLRVGGLGS